MDTQTYQQSTTAPRVVYGYDAELGYYAEAWAGAELLAQTNHAPSTEEALLRLDARLTGKIIRHTWGGGNVGGIMQSDYHERHNALVRARTEIERLLREVA